jgi:hypothetical protein
MGALMEVSEDKIVSGSFGQQTFLTSALVSHRKQQSKMNIDRTLTIKKLKENI